MSILTSNNGPSSDGCPGLPPTHATDDSPDNIAFPVMLDVPSQPAKQGSILVPGRRRCAKGVRNA